MPDSYVLNLTPPAATTNVLNVQTARDNYQLALAEGYEGTRAEWLLTQIGPEGPQGEQGPIGKTGPPGATVVTLTAAEYEALTTEEQEDITKIYAIVE